MTHAVFVALIILLSTYGIVLLVPAFVFVFSEKKINATNPPKTFISVVLPVRNEENALPDCLRSLSELNYPKTLFEVILINDHSTDHTKKIAQQVLRKSFRKSGC